MKSRMSMRDVLDPSASHCFRSTNRPFRYKCLHAMCGRSTSMHAHKHDSTSLRIPQTSPRASPVQQPHPECIQRILQTVHIPVAQRTPQPAALSGRQLVHACAPAGSSSSRRCCCRSSRRRCCQWRGPRHRRSCCCRCCCAGQHRGWAWGHLRCPSKPAVDSRGVVGGRRCCCALGAACCGHDQCVKQLACVAAAAPGAIWVPAWLQHACKGIWAHPQGREAAPAACGEGGHGEGLVQPRELQQE